MDELHSAISNLAMTKGFITLAELHPNDVLFGLAGRTKRPGNLHVRKIIRQKKEEYRNAANRQKREEIIKRIIDTVKSQTPPGRFVIRRLTCADAYWYEMSPEAVSVKINQTFRSMMRVPQTQFSKNTALLKKSKSKSPVLTGNLLEIPSLYDANSVHSRTNELSSKSTIRNTGSQELSKEREARQAQKFTDIPTISNIEITSEMQVLKNQSENISDEVDTADLEGVMEPLANLNLLDSSTCTTNEVDDLLCWLFDTEC